MKENAAQPPPQPRSIEHIGAMTMLDMNLLPAAVDDRTELASLSQGAVMVPFYEDRIDDGKVVDEFPVMIGNIPVFGGIEIEDIPVENDPVDGVLLADRIHCFDEGILAPPEGAEGATIAQMKIGNDKQMHFTILCWMAGKDLF